eukprot:scaffold781_cov394-Prasinococcus_capsulatus_cf.AAC.27
MQPRATSCASLEVKDGRCNTVSAFRIATAGRPRLPGCLGTHLGHDQAASCNALGRSVSLPYINMPAAARPASSLEGARGREPPPLPPARRLKLRPSWRPRCRSASSRRAARCCRALGGPTSPSRCSCRCQLTVATGAACATDRASERAEGGEKR